jgi:hypothetical protein
MERKTVSSDPSQTRRLATKRFGYDARNVSAPRCDCFLALCEELVALVDRGHAGNCSRLVVQDLVGHMGCNSKRGHPGHTRPPQIMNAPVTPEISSSSRLAELKS